MGSKYNLDGLVKEKDYVDARIVDSPNGYKIIIPVFSEAVPSYYKSNVMRTVGAFIEVYTALYSVPLKAEDIYVDGNLSVCLGRKIPTDKKYKLYIVIIIGERCGMEPQDYVIEVPIMPTDAHFAEFRQCILDAFISMVDGV